MTRRATSDMTNATTTTRHSYTVSTSPMSPGRTVVRTEVITYVEPAVEAETVSVRDALLGERYYICPCVGPRPLPGGWRTAVTVDDLEAIPALLVGVQLDDATPKKGRPRRHLLTFDTGSNTRVIIPSTPMTELMPA